MHRGAGGDRVRYRHKPFKVVATARWRDQAKQVCEDLDEQMAAFELVRGEDKDAA